VCVCVFRISISQAKARLQRLFRSRECLASRDTQAYAYARVRVYVPGFRSLIRIDKIDSRRRYAPPKPLTDRRVAAVLAKCFLHIVVVGTHDISVNRDLWHERGLRKCLGKCGTCFLEQLVTAWSVKACLHLREVDSGYVLRTCLWLLRCERLVPRSVHAIEKRHLRCDILTVKCAYSPTFVVTVLSVNAFAVRVSNTGNN